MKTLLLAFLLVSANSALADIEMSGPSVGPSGIGVGKATDGSFKFVDTKTQQVVGNIDFGDVSNVSMHASWNKEGTRVALFDSYGAKLSALSIYERGGDGKFSQVKFDQPNPETVYAARNKKSYEYKDNSGHDSNELGAWTDDHTVWLISGETKEVYANKASSPTRLSSMFVMFHVVIEKGKAQVIVDQLVGPFRDNLNGDKANEFLQNWEQRNALTDSVLQ